MNIRNDATAGDPEIARYERNLVKRERSRLLIRYLIYGVCVASFAGILASTTDFLSKKPIPITQVFFAVLAIATVTAIVLSLLRRIDKHELLIRSESIIGSHSVLISARELTETNPGHPFTEAIRNRAKRVALRAAGTRADRATVQIRAPRGVSLLPLLLVVHLVLVFFAGEARSAAIDTGVREAGFFLEEIGDALAARSEQDEIGLEVAREMQRLGRELQNNRMNRGETERAISELDQFVANTIENREGRRAPDAENRTALPGAPAANQGVGESVFSSSDIQLLLEQLEEGGDISDEEVDLLESVEKAESPENSNRIDAASEEMDRLESARDALDRASALLEPDTDRGDGDQSVTARSSGPEERRDTRSDESSGGGEKRAEGDIGTSGEPAGSAGAGDAAVEDTFTDDFVPGESRFQVVADVSGEVEDRHEAIRTLVRNLPDETRTELPFEDVVRVYGEQIERAVVRSDVSTAMRSYVREYFMRLNEIEEGQIDE